MLPWYEHEAAPVRRRFAIEEPEWPWGWSTGSTKS